MSFEAQAVVWRVRLPASIKVVLLAYAGHANNVTQECFPSAKFVAENAELDRAETWRVRHAMEKHGVLCVGASGKTVFNINWNPTPEQLESFVQDCRRSRPERAKTRFEQADSVLETPLQNVGDAPTGSVLGRPLQNVGDFRSDVGAFPENVGDAPAESENQSTESKESEEEEEAPPPPLWSHVCVAAYTQRFKKQPTKTNAEIIRENVPAEHIEIWREVLRTWAANGWSKNNIAGMCERYESAVRQIEARREQPAAKSTGHSIDWEYMAELERRKQEVA